MCVCVFICCYLSRSFAVLLINESGLYCHVSEENIFTIIIRTLIAIHIHIDDKETFSSSLWYFMSQSAHLIKMIPKCNIPAFRETTIIQPIGFYFLYVIQLYMSIII